MNGPYLSLIVDIVSLLLHVVGNEDLRHQDFLAGFLFFLHFPLTTAVHSLLGTDVQSFSLIFIVSLTLFQESLLGHSKIISEVLRTQCSPLVIYNTINYYSDLL